MVTVLVFLGGLWLLPAQAVLFADRTQGVLLQPLFYAIGVKLVLAGQLQALVTMLEIAVAHHAFFLLV